MGALPKKKRKNWNDNCKVFCVKRKRNNVTSKGDRQKNKLNQAIFENIPLILAPSSPKRIATQILVIAKLNGKKLFFRGFV